MMISNGIILNRLFTHSVFQDLIRFGKSRVYSAVAEKYIDKCFKKKNIDILDEIYRLMSNSYRNEYFYKNTLLTKLLLHRHKLNTTIALTQIPIGSSKADFVLINGKATVYEIKSDLDNYNRLESQLSDYFRAFNRVCVVGPEGDFEKIYEMLSSTPVGIYCLTNRNTFSMQKRKEPAAHNSELEHRSIFKVLHKNEFERIIEDYYGKIPETTQALHYGACFDRFCSIPIWDAYQRSLAIMKNRNKRMASNIGQMPHFLNSILYFLNPSKKEVHALDDFLYKHFEESR